MSRIVKKGKGAFFQEKGGEKFGGLLRSREKGWPHCQKKRGIYPELVTQRD